MKTLYVGNIPYSYGETEITDLFKPFGEVVSARVVKDNHSGRSKGFGFVEMNDADAATAISNINGKEVEGRTIRIDEARPREEGGAPRSGGGERRGGGGGGGYGGGGGGGGRGGDRRGGGGGGYGGGGRGGDRGGYNR